MTDVFISYARTDLVENGGQRAARLVQQHKCLIRRIEEALKELEISVWRDTRLLSGQAFQDEINTAIRQSKVILVCWSPDSVKSDWVRAEASFGQNARKLVPATIRSVEIPVPFNLIQATNFINWTGSLAAPEWQQLVQSLSVKLDRPGLAEYCALSETATYEQLRTWLTQYRADPLVEKVLKRASDLHLEELTGIVKPAAAPATAQADDEANVLYDITLDRIVEILQDMGYRATAEREGPPRVKTRIAGMNAQIFAYNETNGKYSSIQVTVLFQGAQGLSHETVNAVNALKRFCKMYLDREGDLVIEFDLLFRGGIHLENLKASIDLFEAYLSDLGKTIDEASGAMKH